MVVYTSVALLAGQLVTVGAQLVIVMTLVSEIVAVVMLLLLEEYPVLKGANTEELVETPVESGTE